MRLIRLTLYFVVGLLLGAVTVLARADVIPATQSQTDYNWSWGTFYGSLQTVVDSACQDGASAGYPSGTNPHGVISNAAVGQFYCQSSAWDGSMANWWVYRNAAKESPIYTCPSGYTGPKTVNGQANMCESADKCAPTKDKSFSGWVVKPPGGYGGTVCIDGCQYDQMLSLDTSNPQDERIGKDGRIWGPVSQYGKGTSCTGTSSGGTTNDGQAPTGNNNDGKKAPCGGSDGVMTTSTGKVLCVPEGTPDARKPGVTQEKKVEVFQDGSKKETTTTTTQDPQTGAKDTQVSTTTSAGPGGGTMAGAPGTSTSSGATTSTNGSNGAGGSGEGGDGDCDPSLNFCGGPDTKGTYTKKDKTLGDAFSKFSTGFSESGLGQAMTGFFTVNVASGSCPSWTVNSEYLNWSMDLGPYFCNATALQAFTIFGNVLLLVVTFLAFRWAIL